MWHLIAWLHFWDNAGSEIPTVLARNVRVQFGPVVSATPVFRVERDVTVIVETP